MRKRKSILARSVRSAAISAVMGFASPIQVNAEGNAAQSTRFVLHIEHEQIAGSTKTIQVRRGDAVEIEWSADRRADLHLHGYDIETTVEPGKTQTMKFLARATGRFPIELHGGRHKVLMYVEVHPR